MVLLILSLIYLAILVFNLYLICKIIQKEPLKPGNGQLRDFIWVFLISFVPVIHIAVLITAFSVMFDPNYGYTMGEEFEVKFANFVNNICGVKEEDK